MRIAMYDITAALGLLLAVLHAGDALLASICVFLAEVALVHALVSRKHRKGAAR